jgi:type II secretory pathway pseudopilin PulG
MEIMIGMVVLAILGTALTQMLLSDSRFVNRQEAMLDARQSARAAMNIMTVELRLVADNGLVAASPESVTVQMPYAFGMACQSAGGVTTASLTPTDSLMYALAVADGLAWRSNAGVYTNISGVTVSNSSNSAACTADGIRVLAGGSLVDITGIPGGKVPPPGRLFYFYQTVTYRFAPSTELPGRVALWRSAGSVDEEIVAPFDSTAGFACLTGPFLQVETCPSSGGLPAVRGLELRLIGASTITPSGGAKPATFDLVTQVPFLNKVN